MPMLDDWIGLCRSFNVRGVEYLLVGGQAVIAHGYPRLTKDMDLWVNSTVENGKRILRALEDFGAPLTDFEPTRFADPDTMLMLGVEPFRIDILTSLPGVRFVDAWSRRTTVLLDGETILLIGRQDLIMNKKAVGRLQDLADVEALEAVAEIQRTEGLALD